MLLISETHHLDSDILHSHEQRLQVYKTKRDGNSFNLWTEMDWCCTSLPGSGYLNK